MNSRRAYPPSVYSYTRAGQKRCSGPAYTGRDTFDGISSIPGLICEIRAHKRS